MDSATNVTEGSISPVLANLPDNLTMAIAERAACNGYSFDATLAEIVRRGLAPPVPVTVQPSLAYLVGHGEAVNGFGSGELNAHAGEVWRWMRSEGMVTA